MEAKKKARDIDIRAICGLCGHHRQRLYVYTAPSGVKRAACARCVEESPYVVRVDTGQAGR